MSVPQCLIFFRTFTVTMVSKQTMLLFSIYLMLQFAFAYKAEHNTDQLDQGRKERKFVNK